MGSKSSFWRWLLQRIPACGTFYDLFAGGCSVGHMMGHFVKCERVVFNDANKMPLELFRMAINGELPPPVWMSSEEFKERNKAGDPLSLLFSFGAKTSTYFCSQAVEPWQRELFHAKISGDYSFFCRHSWNRRLLRAVSGVESKAFRFSQRGGKVISSRGCGVA